MGSIFKKREWLYLRVKDAGGKWRNVATGLRVGEEKRAEKMLRDAEAAIGARVELGVQEGTVASWAPEWIRLRTAKGVAMVRDDERNLRLYVLPAFAEVKLEELRPRQIRRWVEGLSQRESAMGGKLSPRTVRSAYGTLRQMMRDAAREELIDHSPCDLGRGDLPALKDKTAGWRQGAVFSRDELERLISDEDGNDLRRVSYALLGLAGLRWGEAAALTWRAYEPDYEPLGRLTIAVAASDRKGEVSTTKTGATRLVPVHPALAATLARWKLGGWQKRMGRPATPDDLILPATKRATRRGAHALKWLYVDCDRLGLRRRRIHDFRRTFISLAQADGAAPGVVRWITHTPPGDSVSQYTSLPWATLCGAVSPIRVEIRDSACSPLAPRFGGHKKAP